MRLTIVLTSLALLLIISTVTSFVGYRYLSLASEYRERNFIHLYEAHALLDLVQKSPVFRAPQVARAREHLDVAKAQAAWCMNNLSSFEKVLFKQLGTEGAMRVCERDLTTIMSVHEILDEKSTADRTGNSAQSQTALNVRFVVEVQRLIDDSLALHPFVSFIEDKLSKTVRLGTIFAALGLAGLFAFLARDLVRNKRIQDKQNKELWELAVIAERANDAIILADNDGRVTWVNPAFEKMTGYMLKDCVGKSPGSFLQGPETDQRTRRAIARAIRAGRPIKREILNYSNDGRPYWISLSISAVETSDGQPYGFVAISSDISRDVAQREAIKAANQEIAHQSVHDPLTDLPNKRALDEQLDARIKSAKTTTLIRIDLDHFKYVNDTLGHAAGDFVLQEVSRLIRTELESEDLPTRVGGDEFVVVMREGTSVEMATEVSQQLLSKIREPILYRDKLVRVGGSFGVASTQGNLLSIEELLVGADAALYEAKEMGRNCVRAYTSDLHNRIASRRLMARELKQAVANREFVPFFQPQVDAKSRHLVGVETLVRWQSPELGLVMPDAFLPVAERLSILDDIDEIIFDKALGQIRDVQQLGRGIDKISLNVTAQRVIDPNVLQRAQDLRDDTIKIAFEVLESVLIEEQGEHFRFAIDALRDTGVLVEIDDFGSGHASIIGLMQLKPDAMKIDRRLVTNVDDNDVSRNVVESIIRIAKSMDLIVIAEGVETPAQADALTQLGCDVLQGYLFARPMPIHELRRFVLDYRSAA
ncbi:MAG: EAL domain-containing protein [Pseudomonadota bacterium]